MMVGKTRGFGRERSQAFPIGGASNVCAQSQQALLDFWLLEQVLDAFGAGVAKLKAKLPVVRIGDTDFFGEAIEGMVHATLR
jgi:hypothetical protein